MKTFSAKPGTIERKWLLIDAADCTIGRLATQIAIRLMGKHKPIYTPHVDTGDAVVVINAEKVLATGNKEKNKMYYRHSGYPGGIKGVSLEKLRQTHPERIIEKAVLRMLPKGPLGRQMYRKLWVYAGADHPHQAQSPETFSIGKQTAQTA